MGLRRFCPVGGIGKIGREVPPTKELHPWPHGAGRGRGGAHAPSSAEVARKYLLGTCPAWGTGATVHVDRSVAQYTGASSRAVTSGCARFLGFSLGAILRLSCGCLS